jgi:hypothetical protein
MDAAITSKRKYPAYTTAQLEQFVAEIKANETGSDACMRMIAMQDEIDRRKSGLAPITIIPQLCRHKWEQHTSSEPTAAGMHIESFEQCSKCKAIRD